MSAILKFTVNVFIKKLGYVDSKKLNTKYNETQFKF